jgi:hypothetical protein
MIYSGGEQPHQLGPQRGVGFSFWRRGNDILYSRGTPVVQLRDHIAELGLLAADASAWANHTAGYSAQNSGSRMATLGTSAGGLRSVVPAQCSSVTFWCCCLRPISSSFCILCISGWSTLCSLGADHWLSQFRYYVVPICFRGHLITEPLRRSGCFLAAMTTSVSEIRCRYSARTNGCLMRLKFEGILYSK